MQATGHHNFEHPVLDIYCRVLNQINLTFLIEQSCFFNYVEISNKTSIQLVSHQRCSNSDFQEKTRTKPKVPLSHDAHDDHLHCTLLWRIHHCFPLCQICFWLGSEGIQSIFQYCVKCGNSR